MCVGCDVFSMCRKLVGEDSQVLLSEKQDCAFAYVRKYTYKFTKADILYCPLSFSASGFLCFPSLSLSLCLSLCLSLWQVHYFSLNDIHARGFIRQLCFSYITSSPRYSSMHSVCVQLHNHAMHQGVVKSVGGRGIYY